MKDELHIRTLTARFFDGATTHEEEELLYRYYQTGTVPDDLAVYRTLFMGFAALAARPSHRPSLRPLIAAAAVIGAIFTASILFSIHWQHDNYVAYIYGKKTTDKAVVMAEISRTARQMTAINGTDEVELQLREMFTQ